MAPMTAMRKGILLAGGRGTRLHPMTRAVNKHLLPIYDKPLLYYPLATLMLAGVREVLVVSDGADISGIKHALGDGAQWGLSIRYATQDRPGGIAEGVLIGADFLDGEPFCLALGDNVFYGHGFAEILTLAARQAEANKAVILTQPVADPRQYGVVKLDAEGQPVLLVEKPADPPSNQAITGVYFYDARAVGFARRLKPSARGELEITDLNRVYLEHGDLVVKALGRGIVWFDAGSAQNLLLAAELVQVIQSRQRTGIAFPEELAFRLGLIDLRAFLALIDGMPQSEYRTYLETLRDEFRASASAAAKLAP